MEKEKIICPWCNELIVPKVGLYQGQHGNVREERWPKCSKLLFARLEGAPLSIVR